MGLVNVLESRADNEWGWVFWFGAIGNVDDGLHFDYIEVHCFKVALIPPLKPTHKEFPYGNPSFL